MELSDLDDDVNCEDSISYFEESISELTAKLSTEKNERNRFIIQNEIAQLEAKIRELGRSPRRSTTSSNTQHGQDATLPSSQPVSNCEFGQAPMRATTPSNTQEAENSDLPSSQPCAMELDDYDDCGELCSTPTTQPPEERFDASSMESNGGGSLPSLIPPPQETGRKASHSNEDVSRDTSNIKNCVKLSKFELFQQLRSREYQTLESWLRTLMVHFEHERDRDFADPSFMSPQEVNDIVTARIIPEFEKSGDMNSIIREKVLLILSTPSDLETFVHKQVHTMKDTLLEISKLCSRFYSVHQELTRAIIDPIANLSEVFETKKPNASRRPVEKHFEILENISNTLCNTENALLSEVYQLLTKLINEWLDLKNRIDCDISSVLRCVDDLLNVVCAIDFTSLVNLLQSSEDQSTCLNDQPAIFLIGSTGAGKSTLIHFLGGSSFKIVNDNFRIHYEPIILDDNSHLRRFTTSAASRSETSSVNCSMLNHGNNNVWLVDTPGLGDTEGAVKQIANVVGIVQAIKRCSKVKVVFCISEHDFGNRIGQQHVRDLCTSVMQLFTNIEDTRQLSYVISKLSNPQGGMNRYAREMRKEANNLPDASLTKLLWLDFAEKIEKANGAHAVELMNEGCRRKMLDDLTNLSVRVVKDPIDAFEEFIPTECREPLTRQFQLHLRAIEQGVHSNAFFLVKDKIGELYALTNLLKTKDCVDAFHKSIAILFQVLSDDLQAVTSNCNELLSAENVWNDHICQLLATKLGRLKTFNSYYDEQFQLLLGLVSDCESNTDFAVERKNFLCGLEEQLVLRLNNRLKEMFGESFECSYKINQVHTLLTNVDFIHDCCRQVLSSELFLALREAHQTFVATSRKILLCNFQYHCDVVRQLLIDFKFVDAMESLRYLSIFAGKLQDMVPAPLETKLPEVVLSANHVSSSHKRSKAKASAVVSNVLSFKTEVHRCRLFLCQVVDTFIETKLLVRETQLVNHASVDGAHTLLTALQQLIEFKSLSAVGIELQRIKDLQSRILNALSKTLSALHDRVMHMCKHDDTTAFPEFKTAFAQFDKIRNHSMLCAISESWRIAMSKHVDGFTRAIKDKCNDQLNCFWDESRSASIAASCQFSVLDLMMQQLFRSFQNFGTQHFDEIIQRSVSLLQKFVENGDLTMKEFSYERPHDVETQLIFKYRSERLLEGLSHDLYSSKSVEGSDEMDELTRKRDTTKQLCNVIISTVGTNFMKALQDVIDFYQRVEDSFNRLSNVSEFVASIEVDSTFDFGKRFSSLVRVFQKCRLYLVTSDQQALDKRTAWIHSEVIPKHYQLIDSALSDEYRWLATGNVRRENLLHMSITSGMFNALSDGLRYFQQMKAWHSSVRCPLDQWVSTHLSNIFDFIGTASNEQHDMTLFTQLSFLSRELAKSMDGFMPKDRQFAELASEMSFATKEHMRTTRAAIRNHDYQVVAQGLQGINDANDSDDDFDDGVRANAALTKAAERLTRLRILTEAELRKQINAVLPRLNSLTIERGAIIMKQLWKDLVELNQAEIYLGDYFQTFGLQSEFSNLIESFDIFIQTTKNSIPNNTRTLLSGRYVELANIYQSAKKMLQAHKCHQLVGRVAGEDCFGDECVCKACWNVVSNNDGDTRNTTSRESQLASKIMGAMTALYMVVDKIEDKVGAIIRGQTKKLSNCASFRGALPPSEFVEYFKDFEKFSKHMKKWLDEVDDQATKMQTRAAELLYRNVNRDTMLLNSDANAVDLQEALRLCSTLSECRDILPQYKDVNASQTIFADIDKLYEDCKQAVNALQLRTQISGNDSIHTLADKYLLGNPVPPDVMSAISDAAGKFTASLESVDIKIAMTEFHDQITSWHKINYFKDSSQPISNFFDKLQKLLADILKEEHSMLQFLISCTNNKEVLMVLISAISKKKFAFWSGNIQNPTKSSSVVENIQERGVKIFELLSNKLVTLLNATRTICDAIQNPLEREDDFKHRLQQLQDTSLLDCCHYWMEFHQVFLDFFGPTPSIKSIEGVDVREVSNRFPVLYSESCDFLKNEPFINSMTKNVNGKDRIKFYYQVVIRYVFVASTSNWMKGLYRPFSRQQADENQNETDVVNELAGITAGKIVTWMEFGRNALFTTDPTTNNEVKALINFDQNGDLILMEDDARLERFNLALSNLELIAQSFVMKHNRQFQDSAEGFVNELKNMFYATFEPVRKWCINQTRLQDVTIVKVLVTSKRWGNIVSSCRDRINKTIDQIINTCVQGSKSKATDKQLIGRIGNALNESQDGIGQQIIAEHSIFKGYEIYLRNTRFSRLSNERVVDLMKGDDFNKDELLKHAKSFDTLYRDIVRDYLNKIAKIGDIPTQAHDLVKSVGQRLSWSTVLNLIAKIFGYWTLSNAEHYLSQGDNNRDNLLQPHSGQVLAILRLFGFDTAEAQKETNTSKLNPIRWFTDNTHKLQNQLVQIRTGEGKSIILGVVAIVLALTGCEVQCACYSKHLSERDFANMASLFDAFGVKDNIYYGTFNDLCETMLNSDGQIRSMVEQLITTNALPTGKGSTTPKSTAATKKKGKSANSSKVAKKRILLIDEVDVFFQDKFYGKSYNIVSSIKACNYVEIENLLLSIWGKRNLSIPSDSLLENVVESDEYKAFVTLFAPQWQELLKVAVKDMLSTLMTFEGHKYEFDATLQQIYYIDSDNTMSYKKVHGYHTMFAYCKEFEDKKTLSHESFSKNIAFLIRVASFSYAEIPQQYDGILGVSGTLDTMSKEEKDILAKAYKLSKFTYLPSVYGVRNLWDCNAIGSCIIVNEELFHHALIDEIRRRQGENVIQRPVLVFFESKSKLEKFREDPDFAMFRNETLVMTTDMKDTDYRETVPKVTNKGRITLLTREFGRGTDFKNVSPEVESVGGSHVISTFVSLEVSEEVQIMGRTGREGTRGSFSLVLPKSEMERIGISDAILEKMESTGTRYDTIDHHRKLTFAKEFPARLASLEMIKEEHDRSQSFVEALKARNEELVCKHLLHMNASHFGDIVSRTVIALDATGSMSDLLNHCKLTTTAMLTRVVEVLKENNTASGFQIKFVVYRNYSSPSCLMLQASSWESTPANLTQFINAVKPNGGMGNEAIELALANVNEDVNNNIKVTQMIIIGDAGPNTQSETDSKRSKNSMLSSHPKYATPVYYEEELKKIKQHGVRINSFYLQPGAEKEFKRMAADTGGVSSALDIASPDAANIITGIVATKILEDIGGAALGNAYKLKYPFQMEGFL